MFIALKFSWLWCQVKVIFDSFLAKFDVLTELNVWISLQESILSMVSVNVSKWIKNFDFNEGNIKDGLIIIY